MKQLFLLSAVSVFAVIGCGGGGSAIAENHAPVAKGKSINVDVNRKSSIKLDATDADGDLLTYILIETPEHGSLSLNGDKAIYIPDINYTGNDSFSFKVKDKEMESTEATVSLNVVERPFKIVVNINSKYEIPTDGAEYAYNYDVDCEDDGTFEATNQHGNYTCNYSSAGKYTIAIRGEFPRAFFKPGQGSVNVSLLEVKQWGTQVWKTFKEAFKSCQNIQITASDTPNLSQVKDMSFMFMGSLNMNSDIGNWDTSNVTNMRGMFYIAPKFNQDISNWNTSNVTDMDSMFAGTVKDNHLDCYRKNAFNQDISAWNTGKVKTMFSMFSCSNFNQNIGNWDVSNVNNMAYMFNVASNFNGNVENWGSKTSNVTDMKEMFKAASSFTGHDLSSWDVDNVGNNHDNFLDSAGSGNIEPNWQ